MNQLCDFQVEELVQLRKQLSDLDAQISDAEKDVANQTNMLSAARGVVGMRGGKVDYSAGDARRVASRSRPKQRVWTQKDCGIVRHDTQSPPASTLSVLPCGMIYTDFQKRFEAPRQSFTGITGQAVIQLARSSEEIDGVGDHWRSFLEVVTTGARMWVIYWFDRNSSQWRHFVRPPRAKGGWRVGLFATRSPNRPSPIGLSLCHVIGIDVENLRITVSGVDILDETPLVALRMYDPNTESHANVRSGWLDDAEKLQPLYYDPLNENGVSLTSEVIFEEEASFRIDFIDERSVVDIRHMILESLKRVDSKSVDCNTLNVLPVGAFRVLYGTVDGTDRIVVRNVISGMQRDVCISEASSDPEARLHLDFQDRYKDT